MDHCEDKLSTADPEQELPIRGDTNFIPGVYLARLLTCEYTDILCRFLISEQAMAIIGNSVKKHSLPTLFYSTQFYTAVVHQLLVSKEAMSVLNT